MMCIIASGYNLFKTGRFGDFFRTISYQNYTSYKVVYVDDDSPDNTTLRAIAFVSQNYPILKDKVLFVHNKGNIGANANYDASIKEECPKGSIVVEIDSDDGLIGRQVFNAVNSIYQSPPFPWFVSSNFIMGSENKAKQLKKGFSQKLPRKVS